jgi:flagellar biosynthesis/type III secretory pathway protein FliH
MPYITSVERIGRQIGREEGREEGRQEGRQMGREEGRQEGRQEGEAAILLRLIELKFGPADESVRRRVREADADTLLRWSERVLTAERLDELLH